MPSQCTLRVVPSVFVGKAVAHQLYAVVGGEYDECVLADALFVEEPDQAAHLTVAVRSRSIVEPAHQEVCAFSKRTPCAARASRFGECAN